MNKRWIICADGTWSKPEQTDQGAPSPTNVVKLAAAILPFDKKGTPQIACYHLGIGAHGGLWDYYIGGALGYGISQNIQDLYLFLVFNYSPGDELFLFGFSRGAYTARSLAGLIRNCGILKDKNVEKYQEAYELYRNRTDETHPSAPKSIEFRAKYSWPDFNIKFIGVWDTVGALGIPLPFHIGRNIWEFHDVTLSSHVDYAYQALAVDERRKPFAPCIWTKQPTATNQVLEQAWFPGTHSNVGGGYEETGLSDCALEWMWHQAAECGLAFDEQQKPLPKPAGVLCDSMTLFYQLFGAQTRTIGAMLPASNEYISQATMDRLLLVEDYRPKNVLEFLQNSPQEA